MSNEGQPRKLSLSRELQSLAANVEALRLAADRSADPSCPGSPDDFARNVSRSLLALRDRLGLLERVVIGASNPALIICHGNEAAPSEDGPGIYYEWSTDNLTDDETDACGPSEQHPETFFLHLKRSKEKK